MRAVRCLPLLVLLVGLTSGWLRAASPSFQGEPVKIGILQSQTGTMAASESPLVRSAQLAIDEVNERGGVLGHKLEGVVADGASDPKVFAQQARRLIEGEHVTCLFGCWTSASRKAVLPVLKQFNTLLWYPVQYEGEEQSPQVIYTGLSANQQLFPALEWLLRNRGRKVFLVGSDYIYPRTTNRLARIYLKEKGAEVVGEVYRPLGSQDFAGLVRQVQAAQPDAILNTLNGDSNTGFFKALAQAGNTPAKIAVMSLSIGEVEVGALLPEAVGHYATWSYFSSLDEPRSRRFVNHYRQRYGKATEYPPVDDPMETAYWQVLAFSLAAKQGGGLSTQALRDGAQGLVLGTPEGLVRIDPTNQHSWRVARVGEVLPDGLFRIVWSSELPLRPDPWWKGGRRPK